MSKSHLWAGSAMAAVAVMFGWQAAAHADPVIDGALSPGEGYSLVSTQINVTSSLSSDNDGPSGYNNEAGSSSTGLTQLSNAYAEINTNTNTLYLFIGGSISENTDTKLALALQTNSNGVSSLAGQTINGEANGGALGDVTFDTGFKPNAFFLFTFDESGASTNNGVPYSVTSYFTDLTGGNAAAPTVNGALNNSLVNTAIGTAGNPTFLEATTGVEVAISLSSLGYTDGNSIEAMLFPSVGSDTRTNNQILAPVVDDVADNYNLTYYDMDRQFANNSDGNYPGNQYFVISVPEPASFSLVTLAVGSLLLRRGNRHH